MYLLRETFHTPFARMLLALAVICALLVTQLGLARHVVEHGAKPVVAAMTLDDASTLPDNSGCLICLEYQAHGSGLTGKSIIITAQIVRSFEAHALAPNTPYLAPERASQRAPPVLS